MGNPALAPPGAPESRQAEKKHKQTKKAQSATITYNTAVDIVDLKPQDNTSTA